MSGRFMRSASLPEAGPNLSKLLKQQETIVEVWHRQERVTQDLPREIIIVVMAYSRLIDSETHMTENKFRHIEWAPWQRNKEFEHMYLFVAHDGFKWGPIDRRKMEMFTDGQSCGSVVKILRRFNDGEMRLCFHSKPHRDDLILRRCRRELVVFLQNKGIPFEDDKEDFLLNTRRYSSRMSMVARMVHESSGRFGFDLVQPDVSCVGLNIDRDTILAMLRLERSLRLEKEFLDTLEADAVNGYATVTNIPNDSGTTDSVYYPPVERLQMETVTAFGFTKENGQMDGALRMLRSAQFLFPNDDEIRRAAFYVEFNRAKQSVVQVGDKMIDVPLMTCGQEEMTTRGISLKELVDDCRPTVVVCGSIS